MQELSLFIFYWSYVKLIQYAVLGVLGLTCIIVLPLLPILWLYYHLVEAPKGNQ